jgi:hypothetical protein
LPVNASYLQWNTNNFTIASIHLLGTALDNEVISKNLSDTSNGPNGYQIVHGQAIEEAVSNLYNLFNREVISMQLFKTKTK